MTTTLLATLITGALASGQITTHLDHGHDEHGACITFDASDDPRSVPNLRKALMQSQRVDTYGVMSDAQTQGMPTYSETTPTIISAAVWYRPTYLSVISEQEIHQRVATWFGYVNQGLRDSGLNVYIRPIFIRNMDYDVRHLEHLIFDGFEDWFTDETNNTYHYDLPLSESPISQYGSLMINGDVGLQFFSEEFETDFHEASYDYGADLHIWVQEGNQRDYESGSSVGIATILGSSMYMIDHATVYEDASDSFIADLTKRTASTLMHEIGHNLGLYHEQSDYDDGFIPRTGLEAFAYGECGVTGNTRTVTWSRNSTGSPNQLLYSNVDLLVDDVACGDPVYSNQASVVRENAPVIATRGIEQTTGGTVSFEQSHVEAYPGYDNVMFEIVRTGDLENAAEVELGLVDGTAMEGVDYFGGAQQLRFREGQDRIVVSLDVDRDESNEPATFLAVLRYPLNLEIDGAVAVATLNADNSNTGEFIVTVPRTVSVEQNRVTEIELTRSGNLEAGAYVFARSNDGTALSDVNYVSVDTYAYFAPGEATATFPVETLRVNSTRDFGIELTSPTDASLTESQISVDIMSAPPGAVHFNASTCSGAGDCVSAVSLQTSRESSTSIPVELKRSGGDSGRLEVTVSYTGGSITSSELNWEEEIVTFADGQTTASFSLEAPANTAGNFTLSVSTSANASGLDATNAPALTARYSLALPAQGGNTPGGQDDDEERQSASVHPIAALFMLFAAIFIMRRRAKNS